MRGAQGDAILDFARSKALVSFKNTCSVAVLSIWGKTGAADPTAAVDSGPSKKTGTGAFAPVPMKSDSRRDRRRSAILSP
jgi:hypothetical protein